MSETLDRDFYREYDLIKARKYPSKKIPAAHQSKALNELHKWFEKKPSPHAGGIVVLPTGGGKTFTAVRFLCSSALSNGYKVLWLAHTHHLLEQAFDSFAPRTEEEGRRKGYEIQCVAEPKHTLKIRVVSGTHGHRHAHEIKPSDDVVIITLQTVTQAYNRNLPALKEFLKAAGNKLFVVFDEAHHSPAPSYSKLLTELRNTYSGMYLLGLTATPTYSDERKQGWLKKLFPQGIIYQVSPQKLMAEGILAKPISEDYATAFSPEFDEREYQKWVGTYQDLPEDIVTCLAQSRERNEFIAQTYVNNKERYGKALIFAERWYQCEQLREFLLQRGVRADAIYSHVDAVPTDVAARNRRGKDENAKVLDAFRKNELDVLINVRMLTEGTDVPDVNTVFLTRQTTSRILLTQMVGRALRGSRFGGTENAYIVSFIDKWKQAINWAEYDQLAEGIADETIVEYGKRPPLQLISIDVVRQLARQMDSGVNVNQAPFLTLMPVGWYRIEFQTLVEGSEDVETVRQLAMVFENEEGNYKELIEELRKKDLENFAGENIHLDDLRLPLEEWKDKFFLQVDERASEDLIRSLFHITRHMAQNDKYPPTFFPFDERNHHNLDAIAKKFVDDDLGARALEQALLTEYQKNDRYWQTIYYTYELFKSQYDGCVNRILAIERHGESETTYHPPIFVTPEENPDREPSEEIKAQVKARDGYRCLCCGEDRKRLLQIDHVAPSYFGGNNSLDNLQTLCGICNRTKGLNTLNFRAHHNPSLTSPPLKFPVIELPRGKKAGDVMQWERFLRRSINIFYRSSAVEYIAIGKRGHYFYEWNIGLYVGNNPLWLEPYLKDLVLKIREAREQAGFRALKSIRISVPDQSDVLCSIDNSIS